MTDDDRVILTACKGVCLLLGHEAIMRITESLGSDEFTDNHKTWMKEQRTALGSFLEFLGAPPLAEYLEVEE